MHAVREQRDRIGTNSGSAEYDLWSPKIGILWDVDPSWQVFANVSRSAEVPTFDVNAFNIKAQTATTYEIGTRGQRSDFRWDISLYRAEIDDELQCPDCRVFAFFTSPCVIQNADKTIHQGIEAGFGLAFLKSTFDLTIASGSMSFTPTTTSSSTMTRCGATPASGGRLALSRAEVLYNHPSGFYAGPNVEWMADSFYADNANTWRSTRMP